jgi:hypothetical protein
VDILVCLVVDDALFEEVLEFLRYWCQRESGEAAGEGRRTFLIVRSDLLVSMMV